MATLSRLPQGWSLANQIWRIDSMSASALYLDLAPARTLAEGWFFIRLPA